jgi:hypothetical protein
VVDGVVRAEAGSATMVAQSWDTAPAGLERFATPIAVTLSNDGNDPIAIGPDDFALINDQHQVFRANIAPVGFPYGYWEQVLAARGLRAQQLGAHGQIHGWLFFPLAAARSSHLTLIWAPREAQTGKVAARLSAEFAMKDQPSAL